MEYAGNFVTVVLLDGGKIQPLKCTSSGESTMREKMKNFQPSDLHGKEPPQEATILISAAIPEEYRPLKTIFSTSWTIMGNTPVYEVYLPVRHKSSKKELFRRCILIATGMGPNFWLMHGPEVINYFRPDLLVSFGFCGEVVTSAARTGLYLPTVFTPPPFFSSSRLPSILLTPSVSVLKALATYGVTICRAISVPIYVRKSLIECDSTVPVILDMESYFAALLASISGVPFISLRASTDGAEEDIPFDVNQLLDPSGFVSIRRVFSLIVRDPRVMASFFRYFLRSLKAARILKDGLLAILNLPLEDLRLMSPPFIVPGQESVESNRCKYRL